MKSGKITIKRNVRRLCSYYFICFPFCNCGWSPVVVCYRECLLFMQLNNWRDNHSIYVMRCKLTSTAIRSWLYGWMFGSGAALITLKFMPLKKVKMWITTTNRTDEIVSEWPMVNVIFLIRACPDPTLFIMHQMKYSKYIG